MGDIRVLRGINIAALVLSIIGVLLGGAFALFMIVSSSALSDPQFFDALVAELQATSSGSAAFDGESAATAYDYSSMSEEELRAMASLGVNIVIGLSVGYALLSGIGIVASALTLRNYTDPAKLGAAFGWTIAAIVGSLLLGSFVAGILFILSAFMNSRIRKIYKMSGDMPGGANPYAGYQQPQPGQYQPGQPSQPQQPGQPSYPQQPQLGGAQQSAQADRQSSDPSHPERPQDDPSVSDPGEDSRK